MNTEYVYTIIGYNSFDERNIRYERIGFFKSDEEAKHCIKKEFSKSKEFLNLIITRYPPGSIKICKNWHILHNLYSKLSN